MTDPATHPSPGTEPDPILLEILRHRLDAINDDAASTLLQISGSQIAVEANDMNTAILDAEGRVVSCGKSVLVLVVSLQYVVQDILREYGENPGIGPGDQFITNDPYVGTIHQPDVVVVAPVFDGDRLIAWTGSCIHHADVGGPVPGGINFRARSIFEEAVPMKPMKLVEADTTRRDVEREFLSRSRRPDLAGLDLSGQVAANRMTVRRLLELTSRYGTDLVEESMRRMLHSTHTEFTNLLAALPDGRWRHVSHLQHDGFDPATGDIVPDMNVAVRLTLTKRGRELVLDFRDSDPQTPGAINASRAALVNFSLAAVLIHLCPELPWTAGAVEEATTILSRPGTVVDAEWPAGVAMSTASSGQAIRAAVTACIARMLDASPDHRRWIMAGCQFAGGGGGVISGLDRDGVRFGTMTLDEISGGGGARTFSDGADTSGFTTSPGGGCANVEVNESYLPIRYLYRRERPDSGGAGRFRGGIGLETAWEPHGTTTPISVLSFGQGLRHPQAPGVIGGDYGGQSGFAISSRIDVLPDVLPIPTGDMVVRGGQACIGASQGGGGVGDPATRAPEDVARDVEDGLVTRRGARRDYGVVLTRAGAVDVDATERERKRIRQQRLGGADPAPPLEEPLRGRPISAAMTIVENQAGDRVRCSHCGRDLAAVGDPLMATLACAETPVGGDGDDRFAGRYPGSDRYVVRTLSCPGCATRIDVQVGLRTDPILESIDTAPLVDSADPLSRNS